MKTIQHLICLAGVAGGLLASRTILLAADAPAADPAATNAPAAPADAKAPDNASQTPQPPADGGAAPDAAAQPAQPTAPAAAAATVSSAATTPAPKADASSAAEFPAGKGLRFNFRDVPLEKVLNYMSEAAGFIINPARGVDVRGSVNVWSGQPLSKEEAVDLLKKVLNQNGYTVMQDKRILTIISTAQAKNNELTPVGIVDDYHNINKDTEVVTEVIPVHGLNATQLLKDLKDMLPNDTTVVANDNANSIMMTDTHANIRRIAEIVATLDSVSSSVNTLQVFSLQYADAKSVADMLKDLFPAKDSSGNGGGFGTRFGRGGRGGLFAGFTGMDAGNGNDQAGGGQAPTSHIGAVADDHSNSVIVSAPEGLMAIIEKVIKEIDVPIQAITEMKVFKLKHADPVETADMLNNLFPDESSTSDAARQGQGGPGGFGFRGGFSAMFAAMRGGGNNNTSESSSRMKLMGRVNAQPDPRTGWLVVVAAKELMPGIEDMIKQLDESTAKMVKAHVITLTNANVYDVIQVLNDVIPPNPQIRSASTSTLTANNVESTRLQTLSQQQNASQATTSQSFGTTPGR